MREYLKVGLITFFVSLALSGLVFIHSPLSLELDSIPITIAIIYPSLIISINLTIIIISAKRYERTKTFRIFVRGFRNGGLLLFFLTYIFFITLPFFGTLFFDLLYLPGMLVAYGIVKPLVSLIIPLPTAMNNNPFVVWPAVMISILFYTLAGAFINLWRHRRREQAQEMSARG